MNDLKLDANRARTLATLVATCRDWNPEAVANVLYGLRDKPLWQVAAAALRAAADPDIRTPAGIAWTDRPHWQFATQSGTPQLPPWRDTLATTKPADPEVVAASRARLRDALAQPAPMLNPKEIQP